MVQKSIIIITLMVIDGSYTDTSMRPQDAWMTDQNCMKQTAYIVNYIRECELLEISFLTTRFIYIYVKSVITWMALEHTDGDGTTIATQFM